MRLDRDDWLSDVLQVSSWTLKAVDGASSGEIATAVASISDTPLFVTAKIPVTGIAAVAELSGAGFALVDTNVTLDFERRGFEGGSASRQSSIAVRLASTEDCEAIEGIAERCFTSTRFHIDRKIGLERANRVKREWAGNSCRGRAAAVYLAEVEKKPAGFLAVAERKTSEGVVAVIDLIGLDTAYQGRGGGRALVDRFVSDWKERADVLRVGTQVANLPAMRLYECAGFRLHEAAYVMHAHIDREV